MFIGIVPGSSRNVNFLLFASILTCEREMWTHKRSQSSTVDTRPDRTLLTP